MKLKAARIIYDLKKKSLKIDLTLAGLIVVISAILCTAAAYYLYQLLASLIG